MSHGRVAENRYRRMDHLGQTGTLGHGWMTGHQKRNPAKRKEKCSTACNPSDRNARLNTAGTCHPTSAAVAASQQTAGCESTRPIDWTIDHRKRGPKTDCTNFCGKPWSIGIAGAPIKIS